MGRTGFCQKSAVFCGFPAKICGFLRFSAQKLRLPNLLTYRASRKSAKICKKSAKMCVSGSGFSLLLSPFWRAPIYIYIYISLNTAGSFGFLRQLSHDFCPSKEGSLWPLACILSKTLRGQLLSSDDKVASKLIACRLQQLGSEEESHMRIWPRKQNMFSSKENDIA